MTDKFTVSEKNTLSLDDFSQRKPLDEDFTEPEIPHLPKRTPIKAHTNKNTQSVKLL